MCKDLTRIMRIDLPEGFTERCQSLPLKMRGAKRTLIEPTPTFIFPLVHNTTPALCSPGMGWMPSCTEEWGGDYTAEVLHAVRDCGPNPPCRSQRGPLFHPNAHTHTHTHAFASPTHTFIEWGSDSECKRPHWYTGQSCLWHQCCWCYCPPRERTITGPILPAFTRCLMNEPFACSSAVGARDSCYNTEDPIALMFL